MLWKISIFGNYSRTEWKLKQEKSARRLEIEGSRAEGQRDKGQRAEGRGQRAKGQGHGADDRRQSSDERNLNLENQSKGQMIVDERRTTEFR